MSNYEIHLTPLCLSLLVFI